MPNCDLGFCDSCIVGLYNGMSDEQMQQFVFECPSCFRTRDVSRTGIESEAYKVRRIPAHLKLSLLKTQNSLGEFQVVARSTTRPF
jgi:hypothetical protein